MFSKISKFQAVSAVIGLALGLAGLIYYKRKHRNDNTSRKEESAPPVAPNTAILLTQNSMIFSLQEFLSLDRYFNGNLGVLAVSHQNQVKLVIAEFWLDTVHPSRLETLWGQFKTEYPFIVDEFLQKHPLNERITFQDFKNLRNHIIEKLKKVLGVEVINANVQTIEINSDNDEIVVQLTPRDDHAPVEIRVPQKTSFIFNALTIPTPNEAIKRVNDNVDLPPQTELYRLSKDEKLEKLVIFGSGLSAVWIKQQFPDTEIRFIIKRGNTFPEVIDRNKMTVIDEKEEALYADEIDVIPVQVFLESEVDNDLVNFRKAALSGILCDKSNIVAIFKKNTANLLFTAPAYNATGFQPNTQIIPDTLTNRTHHIHYRRPRNDEEKMAAPFGPKNLPEGALGERITAQLKALNLHFGNSPIPPVMLIHLEMLYFRQEDLLNLSNYLITKIGIGLSPEFLTDLRTSVKALEDTPNDPIAFIVKVFNQHYSDATMRPRFERELQYIYHQRQEALRGRVVPLDSQLTSSSESRYTI